MAIALPINRPNRFSQPAPYRFVPCVSNAMPFTLRPRTHASAGAAAAAETAQSRAANIIMPFNASADELRPISRLRRLGDRPPPPPPICISQQRRHVLRAATTTKK